MSPNTNKLEYSKWLRSKIMSILMRNEGSARVVDILASLHDEGVDIERGALSYHLLCLVDAKKIVQTSMGRFAVLRVIATTPEARVATMPFGTTQRGWILYAMAVYDETKAERIASRICSDGRKITAGVVGRVLYELRQLGYVRLIDHQSSVLTDRARQEIGLKYRQDSESDLLTCTRMRLKIMEHLRIHGQTHVAILIEAYADPTTRSGRFTVHRELQWLKKNGYARPVRKAVYELTGKKMRTQVSISIVSTGDPRMAIALPLQSSAFFLPVMRHLRDIGPTRVRALLESHGDPEDKRHRSSLFKALTRLCEDGYAIQLWEGVYAATGKPYPGITPVSPTAETPDRRSSGLLPAETHRLAVLDHLIDNGPTRTRDLIRKYGVVGDPVSEAAIRQTVIILRRHGYAQKLSYGLYKATGKTHPRPNLFQVNARDAAVMHAS